MKIKVVSSSLILQQWKNEKKKTLRIAQERERERDKMKLLYQQWYGVNLLIGVMCVTTSGLICAYRNVYVRSPVSVGTEIEIEMIHNGLCLIFISNRSSIEKECVTWTRRVLSNIRVHTHSLSLQMINRIYFCGKQKSWKRKKIKRDRFAH